MLAIRAIASKFGISASRDPVNGKNSDSTTEAGTVCVINGPNLNLLGTRETHIYGQDTLADIEERCRESGSGLGLNFEFLQSNHEGQLVDWIQEAAEDADAIIINAAAYTHTSVAIHDALLVCRGYKIELHISNPYVREPFRHTSFVATAVDGVVVGLGTCAYELAMLLIAEKLADTGRGSPNPR